MGNLFDLPDEQRAAVKHDERTAHHLDGSTSTKFTMSDVDHTTEKYCEWISRQVEKDPVFAKEVCWARRALTY